MQRTPFYKMCQFVESYKKEQCFHFANFIGKIFHIFVPNQSKTKLKNQDNVCQSFNGTPFHKNFVVDIFDAKLTFLIFIYWKIFERDINSVTFNVWNECFYDRYIEDI